MIAEKKGVLRDTSQGLQKLNFGKKAPARKESTTERVARKFMEKRAEKRK